MSDTDVVKADASNMATTVEMYKLTGGGNQIGLGMNKLLPNAGLLEVCSIIRVGALPVYYDFAKFFFKMYLRESLRWSPKIATSSTAFSPFKHLCSLQMSIKTDEFECGPKAEPEPPIGLALADLALLLMEIQKTPNLQQIHIQVVDRSFSFNEFEEVTKVICRLLCKAKVFCSLRYYYCSKTPGRSSIHGMYSEMVAAVGG